MLRVWWWWAARREQKPRTELQKGQAAIFNPRLEWSGDLISGRWNREKGRIPKAHRHLILPVTFIALPFRAGSALGIKGRKELRREPVRCKGLLPQEPFCGGKFLSTHDSAPPTWH